MSKCGKLAPLRHKGPSGEVSWTDFAKATSFTSSQVGHFYLGLGRGQREQEHSQRSGDPRKLLSYYDDLVDDHQAREQRLVAECGGHEHRGGVNKLGATLPMPGTALAATYNFKVDDKAIPSKTMPERARRARKEVKKRFQHGLFTFGTGTGRTARTWTAASTARSFLPIC